MPDKDKSLLQKNPAQAVDKEILEKLAGCKVEKRVLSNHFDGACRSLKPQFFATFVDLQQQLFKMSLCAMCFLSFHYHNFIPTSCGHTYHPACILPLASKENIGTPRCMACNEIFHPNWLASWGLPASSPVVDRLGVTP